MIADCEVGGKEELVTALDEVTALDVEVTAI